MFAALNIDSARSIAAALVSTFFWVSFTLTLAMYYSAEVYVPAGLISFLIVGFSTVGIMRILDEIPKD